MNGIETRFTTKPVVIFKNITLASSQAIEEAGRQSTNTESGLRPYGKFVRDRVKEGHLSLGRFAQVTFQVYCSRNCSMQLLRHKFLDFCEQSQRYSKQEPFFMVPASIYSSNALFYRFKFNCIQAYNEYLFYLREGIRKEDARYILPGDCVTSRMIVGNFQAWYDFLKLRLSEAAQWEIRDIAGQVRDVLVEKAPDFFFEFAKSPEDLPFKGDVI